MPAFAEVGPLQIDTQVQEEAHRLIQNNEHDPSLPLTIERVTLSEPVANETKQQRSQVIESKKERDENIENYLEWIPKFPFECKAIFDKNKIFLCGSENQRVFFWSSISHEFPKITMYRNSNLDFQIIFQNNLKLICSCKDHLTRDLFGLITRYFSAQKIKQLYVSLKKRLKN
jgi:hypothetical protein